MDFQKCNKCSRMLELFGSNENINHLFALFSEPFGWIWNVFRSSWGVVKGSESRTQTHASKSEFRWMPKHSGSSTWWFLSFSTVSTFCEIWIVSICLSRKWIKNYQKRAHYYSIIHIALEEDERSFNERNITIIMCGRKRTVHGSFGRAGRKDCERRFVIHLDGVFYFPKHSIGQKLRFLPLSLEPPGSRFFSFSIIKTRHPSFTFLSIRKNKIKKKSGGDLRK